MLVLVVVLEDFLITNRMIVYFMSAVGNRVYRIQKRSANECKKVLKRCGLDNSRSISGQLRGVPLALSPRQNNRLVQEPPLTLL
jgi:hypothetical protein